MNVAEHICFISIPRVWMLSPMVGLTMVPNVPWHSPPPGVRGPRAIKKKN